MNKQATGMIVAVLLIITGAVGGYFVGKSTETAKNKEVQELNIALSKSELDALGEIEGPIYVTGHKMNKDVCAINIIKGKLSNGEVGDICN